MTLGTLGDVLVGTITSQCEGPGFKRNPGMVCSECSLDVLTVYSVFVLESKDMNVKLTHDFKMSIGMNGYLLFCVSPAVDL